MRRIVHYTDDARSPVSGTENVNDVWQGFRYDFCLLLSAIERSDLSGDAKNALCTELQYLLSDMSCGVKKMSDYADFMAKWQEGFAEIPVKENPAKKKHCKAEVKECGTTEGLPHDAEGVKTETAAAASIEDYAYSSEEEASQARFVAEHGSEDDEGEVKKDPPLIKTITDIYGGDEENGGEDGTLSPDNETEEK